MYINRENRNRHKGRNLAAAFFGAVIVFAIAVNFFWPHLVSGIFFSVSAPFWRTEFSLGSGSLKSVPALLSENERLKREMESLNFRIENIRAVEEENRSLKALFANPLTGDGPAGDIVTNMASSSASSRILAPVIMRPTLVPYDELIIDGGEDRGFRPGDKVFTTEDVLIGKISEVLSGTSKVMLYSSPGQVTQVLIGEGNDAATAIGRGGGQYSAELPRAAGVKEGDYVTAPSLYGKPFGIIRGIASDATQPFITVLFAPPVNIYNLRWVLVAPQ